MNSARLVIITLLLLVSTRRLVADSIQVDAEDFKRLVGDVADLRDANTALKHRVTQLESRNESLQNALRALSEGTTEKFGAIATRDDLSKLAEKLRDLDQKREADRKLILDQIEKLATTFSASTDTSARKTPKKNTPTAGTSAAASKPLQEKVVTYEVQPGDRLQKVLKRYNQQLDQDGRPHINAEQVVAANPGLNPNNLIAGKTLDLPVPDPK
jgi:uncharacterized coiled-coil protein SlyX